MSEKVEHPKKKATASASKPEAAEDISPTSPRKRKAGRTAARGPSAHEVGRVAIPPEPARRGIQGRQSNPVSVQSTTLPVERQRQRHPQILPAHRWMTMDIHRRTRKSNLSSPSSRPLRTRRASVPPDPPRTILQQAWHTVLNSDPLADSDEECPDEHLRLDYNRRMQVITRLRGRPPTPEPDSSQATST